MIPGWVYDLSLRRLIYLIGVGGYSDFSSRSYQGPGLNNCEANQFNMVVSSLVTPSLTFKTLVCSLEVEWDSKAFRTKQVNCPFKYMC